NFGAGAMTSAGKMDMFVAKYSSAGDVQWAKRFGSPGDDKLNALAVDPTSGNIVITGTFPRTNSITFGGPTLDKGSAFLAKLSSADGSHIWCKNFGSMSKSQGNGLAIASNGDIALVGDFDGGLDLTMDANLM